jgi:hypothetical protein
MAVAADRNPLLPSPFGDAKPAPVSGFWADRESAKSCNAVQHQDEGQNVLFLDSHVNFEKTAIGGINEDNFWTHWIGGDIRVGAVPPVGGQINITDPRRADSVLVTDGEGTPGGGGTTPGGTPAGGIARE